MLVWYRALGAGCTWKPLTYTAADTRIKTEATRVLDEIMVASLFYEGKRKLFNDIGNGRRRRRVHIIVLWEKCRRGCLRGGHLPNHAVVFCWKIIPSAGVLCPRLSLVSPSSQPPRDGKDAKTSPRCSVEWNLLHTICTTENQHCLPRNNTLITMVKSLQRSLEAKLASIEGV